MPLHLNWFDSYSWVLGASLDAALLLLIAFRKPVRQVSFFVAYIVTLVGREIWWYYTSQHLPGTHAEAYLVPYTLYWASEFILSLLRLATCIQLWWLSVRVFPAIWKASWRTLAFFSAVLLAWTAISVYVHRQGATSFFYVGEQRFEFMQAFLLVAILAFAAYYAIDFKTGYRAFLVGLCIYSVTLCVVVTVAALNPNHTFRWFSLARQLAFDGMLCLWVYASFKLAPAPKTGSDADSTGIYARLAPELNYRLRELNNQLAGILHS